VVDAIIEVYAIFQKNDAASTPIFPNVQALALMRTAIY